MPHTASSTNPLFMPDHTHHPSSTPLNRAFAAPITQRLATAAIMLGVISATLPAITTVDQLNTIEASSHIEATIGFTSTQLIMIVGGLLTAITGALSLMFRQLLSAQQRVFDAQKTSSEDVTRLHHAALTLKDETITILKDRLSSTHDLVAKKDAQLEAANQALNIQSDKMLAMLDGTVVGTREVLTQVRDSLSDHSVALNALTSSINSTHDTTSNILTNIAQTLSRDPVAWQGRQFHNAAPNEEDIPIIEPTPNAQSNKQSSSGSGNRRTRP